MNRERRNVILVSGLLFLPVGCTGLVGDSSGEGNGSPSGAPAGPSSGGAPPSPGPGMNAGPGGAPSMPIAVLPGPATTSTAFACAADAAPPAIGLRRLTGSQFLAAVRDLAAFALKNEAAVTQTLSALASKLARVPRDERAHTPAEPHGSYRRLDQILDQGHVDAYYDVANAFGLEVAKRERLGALMGACATDAVTTNDAACITDFIKRFGERVLRRPLGDDDVAFYRRFLGTSTALEPAAIADVVAGLLSSPYFLYVVEHGDAPVAGKRDVYALTANEAATRLALQFWDGLPDDDLLAAAASGKLRDDVEYRRQVDRLVGDPRARLVMDRFFEDYFKVEDVPRLDALASDRGFKSFAGADLPAKTLRDSMTGELIDLARHNLWTRAGTFDDLLGTGDLFPRTPDLAAIYGVPVWDGAGAPARAPDGQRPGFLTRAALLSTGLVRTRPIAKGAFIRKWVLCDEIPPPPDNAANTPVDTSTKTSRQAVEAITEQAGSSCAACHASLINPLGFATESFDSLGRARAEERIFGSDGAERLRLPVNTSVVPRVTEGDGRRAAGAGDLVRMIQESGKAHACMARHYFRFTFARWEDEVADGCTLEALRRRIHGGSLRSFLAEAALQPAFRERTFR